jgi:hypothetical protein
VINAESPFNQFRKNFYSQNGEDGVIQELFNRLQIGSSGWVVEFGAWDGRYLSNTYYLIESRSGFKTVYIESDPVKFEKLCRTAAAFPGRIVPICSLVSPEGKDSLDNILKNTPITHEFDLLSIDIDGMDYHIWEGLKNYRPKIVIIEVNSSIPPDQEQIHSDSNPIGSSFKSMVRLGQQKGYTLICHTGNVIFIRNDLLVRLSISEKYKKMFFHPEILFDTSWL